MSALLEIEDHGIDGAAELVWCRDAGEVVDAYDLTEGEIVALIRGQAADIRRTTTDPAARVRAALIEWLCGTHDVVDTHGDAARTKEIGHRCNAHGDLKRINHAVEVAVTGKESCMACSSRRCVCGGAA